MLDTGCWELDTGCGGRHHVLSMAKGIRMAQQCPATVTKEMIWVNRLTWPVPQGYQPVRQHPHGLGRGFLLLPKGALPLPQQEQAFSRVPCTCCREPCQRSREPCYIGNTYRPTADMPFGTGGMPLRSSRIPLKSNFRCLEFAPPPAVWSL